MSEENLVRMTRTRTVATVVSTFVLVLGASISLGGWVVSHFATTGQMKEIVSRQASMEMCLSDLRSYATGTLAGFNKVIEAHVPYVTETVMMIAVHEDISELTDQQIAPDGSRPIGTGMYQTHEGHIDKERELEHRQLKRQQEWGRFMAALEALEEAEATLGKDYLCTHLRTVP